MIDQFGYEGYIIADWGTEIGNKFTLERNQKFPSCPPEIPILKSTIQAVVKAFFKSEKNWFETSIKELKQTSSYNTYRNEVDKATGAKTVRRLFETFAQPSSATAGGSVFSPGAAACPAA